MRVHRVFYVGLLKPDRDPAHMNAEALTPEWIPRALGHSKIEPATGSEHGVQQPPFLMAPSAPPLPAAMHSPAPRLAVAPTERGSPQGEAAGARRTLNHQERPHGVMLLQRDAQRSSDHESPHPQGLEVYRESPDGDRPGRHRPPPTLLDEIDDVHYHVERLVGRRRHQGQTIYLVKWREYPDSENSWEFETPLWQDHSDAVDAFDQEDQDAPRHQTRFLAIAREVEVSWDLTACSEFGNLKSEVSLHTHVHFLVAQL
ncbi:Heterochromatin-associated protein HP1 and related CHROMO domain proteins [Plasmopara halstedii]|uniref:Heterochromatin-associated protein HP1 and related CHROMO domain proteins n=1 Tax=Plasmopara halstedii TaxID=4781 RepID=A0A0N7L6N1_PLAHL|nr:Heterochromatin-associated protein HP1 and related CHROMO domain proteins [Plasmopara halstedii]CEG44739.1 Heterochromatin-associated protein HP1 and related CHROMO domain proteins [Plasmopara halstedii]|eukprot:XP_024581108.1 Heterochromatin-associated protein HP1 and related CHROMO domain proteins [Plasmopara halstedii]